MLFLNDLQILSISVTAASENGDSLGSWWLSLCDNGEYHLSWSEFWSWVCIGSWIGILTARNPIMESLLGLQTNLGLLFIDYDESWKEFPFSNVRVFNRRVGAADLICRSLDDFRRIRAWDPLMIPHCSAKSALLALEYKANVGKAYQRWLKSWFVN